MKNTWTTSWITIDCHYTLPTYAASFLKTKNGRAVFVENNTRYAVPYLLAELKKQGLSPDCVDYAFITHIHLDHAGGSSHLLELCPNAKLVAHPRSARHAMDPSRLVASAEKVYGKERYQKLYGQINPIPQERVIVTEDGDSLDWEGVRFKFFHTRGHANHHECILDTEENTLFTGDSFGIAYPQLQKKGLFTFPSTSPTDYDGKAALETIEQIVELNPASVHLTHYGRFEEVARMAEQLTQGIQFSENLVASMREQPLTQEDAEKKMKEQMERLYQKETGQTLTSQDWELLKIDYELNAAGLIYAASRPG